MNGVEAKLAIEERLRERHREDRLVFECKTGATMYGSHLRLDAWAMKCSWAHPVTYGYEIKVGRSDFVRDEKWQGYLDYCSDFYFCCPHGLIQPEELPEGVGLLWLAKTGSRLYTKRKAARREVSISEDLWRYVLMSRAQILEREEPREDARAYWKSWLSKRKQDRELGWRVSRAIRDKARELEIENSRLRSRMSDYDGIRERLKELGFDPEKSVNTWAVRNKLAELQGELPPGLAHNLAQARDDLQRVLDAIKRAAA